MINILDVSNEFLRKQLDSMTIDQLKKRIYYIIQDAVNNNEYIIDFNKIYVYETGKNNPFDIIKFISMDNRILTNVWYTCFIKNHEYKFIVLSRYKLTHNGIQLAEIEIKY